MCFVTMRKILCFQTKRFGRNMPACCVFIKYLVLFSLLSTVFLTVAIKIRQHQRQNSSELNRKFMMYQRDLQDTLRPNNHTSFFEAKRNFGRLKIDWHNHKFIEMEAQRTGPGEQGAATELDESDISVNRSLPDVRNPACQHRKYLARLPTASVIIVFSEVPLSRLLRTVNSLLNRAPIAQLHEIILINDNAKSAEHRNSINRLSLGDKVKVIHLQKRMGLAAGRMVGAQAAQGDVLVFADSNLEANVNWLPPLLEPIADDYKVCTVPLMDRIDNVNFKYTFEDIGSRRIFNWKLDFFKTPLLLENSRHLSEPFKTPVLTNPHIFAMSANFFWELGGHDFPGAEQLEISFKVWMCGGEILAVPCSRFGRVNNAPAPKVPINADQNLWQMLAVWMADPVYKKHVNKKNPGRFDDADIGDLSRELKRKAGLQCKSFDWFLQEVGFDVLTSFPLEEPEDFASGTVKSLSNPDFCVDNREATLKLRACEQTRSEHQNFRLTFYHDILDAADYCWDAPRVEQNGTVTFRRCHQMQGNQFWKLDPIQRMIMKDYFRLYCLECHPVERKVFLNFCDITNLNQKFQFSFVNYSNCERWGLYGANLLD